MIRSVCFIAVSILFLAAGFSAQAQVTFLTDKNQYVANHPDQQVQLFASGNVAPGSFQFCDSVFIDFTSNNPCFSPGDILPGLAFFSTPSSPVSGSFELRGVGANANSNPRKALGRQTDGDTEFIEILFGDGGVSSAGIVPGCFDGTPPCNATYLLQIYSTSGALLDEIQVPVTDLFNTFVGFDSSVPVGRVTLSDSSQLTTFEMIDEVRFTAIPEAIPTLSEWGLIVMAGILGIVGFIVMNRRKASA